MKLTRIAQTGCNQLKLLKLQRLCVTQTCVWATLSLTIQNILDQGYKWETQGALKTVISIQLLNALM